MLTTGRRTALPRHQTLRATLDWSYQLLSPVEQCVLRRLSVFRGRFTMASAVQLASGSTESEDVVREAVGNLSSKSLLTFDLGRTLTRYRLLDTTRLYADEKLKDSGEFEAISRRHAIHHAEFFDHADLDWERYELDEWLSAYGERIDDLRAALDWAFSEVGDTSLGISLTAASAPLWLALLLMDEFCGRAESALSRVRDTSLYGSETEMKLRLSYGVAIFNARGALPTMATEAARALEIATANGATEYQLRALLQLGRERSTHGDYLAAMSFCERFEKIVDESGDQAMMLVRDRLVGLGLFLVGRHTEARIYSERAVHRPVSRTRPAYESLSEWDHSVASRSHLGRVLWVQGFPDRAASIIDEGVESGLRNGYPPPTCHILTYAACPVAFYMGHEANFNRYVRLLREQTADLPFGFWHRCLDRFEQIAALGDYSANSVFWTKAHAITHQIKEAVFLDIVGTMREELVTADVLRRSSNGHSPWCAPEIFRAEAKNILRRDGANGGQAAEDLFLQSLRLATQQGALSWQLRSATSLAQLWSEDGRSQEALSLLAPIYSRFIEGFASLDLRRARALLGELD
jgi:predicted ATPase